MKGTGLKRGAFIVFEGCDKVGKTTQCQKLAEKLQESGISALLIKFPDRSTATGQIINDYLIKKKDMTDQAVHLLFSANRWENQPKMKQCIERGTTLIVDRYSYSGVAYSAAKAGMDINWCYKPEIGLPKPDVVFFMHIPVRETSSRADFGEERYEKCDFQNAVFKNYMKLKDSTWKMIDASRSIQEIHEDLLQYTRKIIEQVQSEKLKTLSFSLSPISNE